MEVKKTSEGAASLLWLLLVIVAASLCSASPEATPPQIGNGYIATFVNTSDVFIAGVFNGAGSNSQRAPFRATTRTFASVCANNAGVETVFVLNPFNGTVTYTCSGSVVSATHTWYAHRVHRRLLVQDIAFAALHTAMPTLVPLTNFASPQEARQEDSASSGQYTSATTVMGNYTTTVAPGLEATVTTYQTQSIENSHYISTPTTICEVSTVVPEHIIVTPNGTTSLRIFTTYCSDAPFDRTSAASPCACALNAMEAALTEDYEQLLAAHVGAWSELRQHTLEIEPSTSVSASGAGASVDPVVLQDVIDGSFYGLLSSLHDMVPYSTSPGGLPTNGYRGHTFWDMETWMFPNLAVFFPSIAAGSAIQYRLDRTLGALDNAVAVVGGANGSAAFPWESAFSGFDVCPWPQGEHSELHVTADVVLGWQLYHFLHPKNTSFLQAAFPLLNATSYFWLTRCERDAATGQWHLNGVTPPDEYHFGNDSVYTNAAVKLAVNFTLYAASVLSVSPVEFPSTYAAQLQDLVENLVILYDEAANYHPEFAGYNGTSIVKQADVILLNFPMGHKPLEATTVANDLRYYESRTDPGGPAMTWSMFAVGYLSLSAEGCQAPSGTRRECLESGFYYFMRGFENNTFPPYYQWYEVAGGSGCPNFLTGAGGFLQSVWAGLLQLRVVGPGVLKILSTATLPSTVQCVKAKNIRLGDSQVSISVCRSAVGDTYEVKVQLNAQGPEVVSVDGIPLILGEFITTTLAANDVVVTITDPVPPA